MFSTTTKNHIFLVISETSLKQVKIKGGGVQVYHFGKYDFELRVGVEGQDIYRHFEGGFGSMRAILTM